MDNKRAVVIVSGGLDSSTLLAKARFQWPEFELYAVSFDYGQKHVKELDYAYYQAQAVDAEHKIVDLTGVTELLAISGSSLISQEEVPEGHYAEDNMSKTVVPNRNMIMLAIAGGYAVALGARVLATGVHAGDHAIYPDCRPEFLSAFDAALWKGNQGFISPRFELWTPFLNRSKNEIATEAVALGVEIDQTWSCYKGGDIHCGRCGTCVERQEAIASTGIEDPTPYLDNTFWKDVVSNA